LNNDILKILHQDDSPINIIKKLKDSNLISVNFFDKALIDYLESETDDINRDVGLVLVDQGDGIYDITNFGDADNDDISRARGGMIQATVNKIKKYDHYTYLIMPIKNTRNQCRFYLKGFGNRSVIKNMLNS
jgi:hypothetical protein